MRERVNNPVYMKADEIHTTFDGKWVLVTNAEMTDSMDFIGGIPVVIADSIYEGHDDGYYNEFVNNDDYAPCLDLDFRESSVFLANAFFNEVAYAD